ncbi:MAG TPA: protein kinase [Prosthecobacter sp.]|nr:protein kinase [Prosthecobacter sp.]
MAVPNSSTFPSLQELSAWLPAFEVLRRLESGRDSAVYLARQTALERLVDIRVMRNPGGQEESLMLARLRARAKLVHPNCVAVYDVGKSPAGLWYLISEHIEARAIAEQIQGREITPKTAFTLALPLCSALQAVHDHGLHHGALSPRTVLITSAGQLKLTGIGMARLETGELTWIHGDTSSKAADIRALGATLHEMFARQPPSPDGRTARELPPAFALVLRRCLETDPARQYTSAAQAGHALLDARQAKPKKEAAAPKAADAPPAKDFSQPAATPPARRPVPPPPQPIQRQGRTFMQKLDAFLWDGLKVGLHLTVTLVSIGSLVALYLFKDRIVIEERIERPGALPPNAAAQIEEPPIPAAVMGALPAAPTLPVTPAVPSPSAAPIRLPAAPDPLEQLRAQYTLTVQDAAQQALNKLLFDDLPHLQRELTLLQNGSEIPDLDEPTLPSSLKQLRQNYREARARILAPKQAK